MLYADDAARVSRAPPLKKTTTVRRALALVIRCAFAPEAPSAILSEVVYSAHRGLNSPWVLIVALVLVLLVDGFLLYRYRLVEESAVSAPPSTTEQGGTTQGPSTSPSKQQAPTAIAAEKIKEKRPTTTEKTTTASIKQTGVYPVVVSVVHEPAWLLVRVDGETALKGAREPGFSRQFEADQEVYIETANAGAVGVVANGQSLARLGARGAFRFDVVVILLSMFQLENILKYGFFTLAGFMVGILLVRTREKKISSPASTGDTWGTDTRLGTAGGPATTAPTGPPLGTVSDPAKREQPQRPEDPNHTGYEREYSDPSAGPVIGHRHHPERVDIPVQLQEAEKRTQPEVGEDPRTLHPPRSNVEVDDDVAEIYGEVPSEEDKRARPATATKKGSRTLLEFLIILLVTFALVFGVVRPFVAEVFYIPTESMVPTLEISDRVVVNKLVYRFSAPQRGDIIVFESPDGEVDLVKRVIGVPGDKVGVVSGSLYVNDERWEEPYLNPILPDTSSYGPITVPEGRVFVMGDNRADSADSRYIGPVPLEYVEGEAFVRIWPLDQLGFL